MSQFKSISEGLGFDWLIFFAIKTHQRNVPNNKHSKKDNDQFLSFLNEAFFVLAEGIATPEDIDNGMKLGCNHPIGPLALADLVGLDTTLAVMEVYFENFSDSKYRPCPLLREMVAAGYLGRKSGRGVYHYWFIKPRIHHITRTDVATNSSCPSP